MANKTITIPLEIWAKMKDIKKHYKKAYSEVMDTWDDMNPEKIVDPKSREQVLDAITAKIGKAA